MANLTIDQNGKQKVKVQVQLSDSHTKDAYVKFTRLDMETLETSNCNEMLLAPFDLEVLGKFLVAQAAEIRSQLNSN